MKLRQLLDPIFLYRNGRHFIRRLDERRDHFTNNWKLRRLQNRHCGGRCFIIGNGPSLTMTDLEQLRDEVTFASNKIYLAFKMTSWRPSYYVLEDNHMIEQHHEEIRHHLSCPKFVTDQWRHLFREERRVIWYPWRYAKEYEFPRFSDKCLRRGLLRIYGDLYQLAARLFHGIHTGLFDWSGLQLFSHSLRSELYCARRGFIRRIISRPIISNLGKCDICRNWIAPKARCAALKTSLKLMDVAFKMLHGAESSKFLTECL